MLTKMNLGIFYPGSSLMHRLQARTKLLINMWLVVILVIANRRLWHFVPYGVVVALVIGAVCCSGISLRVVGQRLWLLLLLAFTSVFLSIFGDSGNSRIIWQLGPWMPHYAFLSHILWTIGGISAGLLLFRYVPPVHTWYRQYFWLRFFWIVLLFLVIALVFFFWLTSDFIPTHSLSIGPLIVTQQGFWILMVSFLVFAVLYTFSLLLTMTTKPVALIEGLTLLLSPLRYLKLPVDDFALMTLLALRFIPTLMDEAEQLMKAQAARGADLTHGTLRERIQSVSMFFIPLVQGTLRRAAELATALDARGYESDSQRTLLYEQSLGHLDYLVLAIVVVTTASSLLA